MGGELGETGVWQESRKFKIKNSSRVRTLVALELHYPFSLSQVLSEDGNSLLSENETAFTVQPLQVFTVSCCLHLLQPNITSPLKIF